MADKVETIETAQQVLASRMGPADTISKKDYTEGKVLIDGLPEKVLDEFARTNVDPLHKRDLEEIRERLEDSAPISSLSRKRAPGMSEDGTMRFAGSIPVEIWNADEILRPYMTPQERARDLLKRHPEYAVGKMRGS